MRIDYISDTAVLGIIRDHPNIGADQIARIGYPALWDGSTEFRIAKRKLYTQLQKLKKYQQIENTGLIEHGPGRACTWRAVE